MTSEWKDWYTETYEYTVGSIENLDILILDVISQYIHLSILMNVWKIYMQFWMVIMNI